MSNNLSVKPSILFWIAGVVFLIWNGFGCFAYLMDQTLSDADYAKAYGDAMASVRDLYPVWATAGYAIAVWGGLLAAILFLLRKKMAVPIFALSLLAAIISFIPGFTMSAFRDAAGPTAWVMPIMVFVLGLIEVFYSRNMRTKGVLR